jgi:Fe-S cluster assembly ATP-binding protein
MSTPLLQVSDLSAKVEGELVLDEFSFAVDHKEVVALMGANGSGKSSLAMTLMGDSKYQTLDNSSVKFGDSDLLAMTPDERARAGLYVAWQNPVAITGVSVFNLCKSAYEATGHTIPQLTEFKVTLEKLASRVGLSKEYIGRNINEGFSGGEKKRLELLQLLLIKPKLAILDEIDSGLDVDGLKMVSKVVNEMRNEGTAFILITHYKKLLDYVSVNKICLMSKGKIVKSGGMELGDEIEEQGYGKLQARI